MQWAITLLGALALLLPQVQPIDPCQVVSMRRLGVTGDIVWSQPAQMALMFNRDAAGNWETYSATDLYNGPQTLVTPGTRHHVGVDWAPDGQWFVGAVEWESNTYAQHTLNRGLLAVNAFHTDLYAGTPDGKQQWRLTDYEHNGGALGAMAPHVSPDGKLLLWSVLLTPGDAVHAFGTWQLWLADVVWTEDGPHLEAATDITPEGASWAEAHGFTPDGAVLFTSDLGLTDQTGQDEWRMDMSTGELTNLTNSPDQWDEHIHASPSGNRYVWMSSAPYDWPVGNVGALKTEVMLMDADGSHVQQLTHFNTLRGYAESTLEKSMGVGVWRDSQHVLVIQVLAGIRYPQRRDWELSFAGDCGG